MGCVANHFRRIAAADTRKKASFQNSEIEHMHAVYQDHLKGNKTCLSTGEMLWLLIKMGMHINTTQDRNLLLNMVDMARQEARKAGVDPVEVGEDKSSNVPFWTFVHFVRLAAKREEEARVRS